MSLLSEKVATVLQGQYLTAETINSSTVVTDVLVAGEVAITNLDVSESVSFPSVISANSFLNLHQFQSVPANTADTSLIVSNDPNNTYNRGVLAPNNKIYCFPRKSENVLIIDPVANTTDITSITGLSNVDNKWLGGAVAPNGKIYGIPYVADQVLIIDPVTNTADTTTIAGLTGLQKWSGGVLSLEGKIYGMPNYDPSVLIIDPVTNTADRTTITGLTTVGDKYNSGVLGPDNKIYAVPLNETRVLVVDPNSPIVDISNLYGITVATAAYVNSTKTLTTGTTLLTGLVRGDNIVMTTTSGKYTGYIETLNNTSMVFVYALGVDLVAGTITKLEKTRKADVTSIVGFTGGSGSNLSLSTSKYTGGVLGADNKIYCMCRDAASFLIIDPYSPTVDISSSYGIVVGSAAYVDSTRTLTTGTTLLSGLSVGDNIIITTTSNPPAYYTGYIRTLNNTSMIFMYPLGTNITAGNIASIQKTRKADVTTLALFSYLSTPLTAKYLGGSLAQNGLIYGMPLSTDNVVIVNPASPTVDISSLYGIVVGSAAYVDSTRTLSTGTTLLSGLSVGDNIIITTTSNPPNYFTGYIQTLTNSTMTFVYPLGTNIGTGSIAKVEKTRKLDVTTIAGLAGTLQWNAGILAPNGNIYGVPQLSNSVLKVRTSLPTLPPWMLQAYFNKF